MPLAFIAIQAVTLRMANQEVLLKVDGMTCNNCAAGIAKTLKQVGFADADANFLEGEVSFTLTEGQSVQPALDALADLGYTVQSESSKESGRWSRIEKKFAFSALFTLPLLLHMVLPAHSVLHKPEVQIALCLPVYLLGFVHFGKSAWGSLKAGMANMDVLIFMGSTAAFGYSLAGTMLHWGSSEAAHYLYFETTATIITLVLLGNVLEHRSVKETTRSLVELAKLEAPVARIVMRVGTSERIFETEPAVVKPGDLLQINEGDRVPADAHVESGVALVDESAITGEAEPVRKQHGDVLRSGTLVLSGNLRATATAPAKESTLQKIAELVKKARRDQPHIQQLGDKVSTIFVPVVVAIAIGTFTVTWLILDKGVQTSLMNAIAVLVISCPCAMGLATPTAVVAGVGRAARMGILIKGGSTLERFAQVGTMAFDKTGTLTTGAFKPVLVSTQIGKRALALAKGLEAASSHPIARSIRSAWPETAPEMVYDLREEKGKGVSGLTANGETVRIGRAPAAHIREADLALYLNEEPVALLSITDRLKPGAAQAIQALKAGGLKVALLSGDRADRVKAIAEKVGIAEWKAEMTPEEKLLWLEEEGKERFVAMTGDGINDGPALARAHVGIAPAQSSALAFDLARVVILGHNELEAVVMAWKVSKHTYLTIKQNLFWAFFYNVVAIPIAAAGFLNPMIAALAMAFSDVVVIGNSIRLKYKNLR